MSLTHPNVKLINLTACAIICLCLIAIPHQSQAAPKGKSKATQTTKEKVILMPVDITVEDRSMINDMQNAVEQGLMQKYQVFSGEQVLTELKKSADKQNKSTKKTCDETKCLQDVSMAFGNALVAMVHVKQITGGYTLSINILDVLNNETVFANQISCKGCDSFQLLDKLKELVGIPATVAAIPAPVAEAPQAKVNLSDPETALWEEAKKGNAEEDYQAYLTTYPKGKYVPLAKTKLARLKDEARAAVEQQDQQAWNTAQQGGNQDSYASYLSLYPRGQYAALAQGRIDKIKREAASAEATQRREQAAAEAKRKQEQEAAAAEAEKKKRETPKGFVSQGGLTWMPVSFEKNWSDANSYCSNTAINGQTGWRLPTKEELSALYNSGAMKDQGWALSYTWSSTPGGSGGHSYVTLGNGSGVSYGDPNDNYVTCVQATAEAKHKQEQEAAAAEAENKKHETPKGFVSQGGLTWMPVSFYKPWAEANAYCTNTAINGQAGWRLPTKEELSALYNSGSMNDQGGTLAYTWSSTPDGSGKHYRVNLYSGYDGSFSDTDSVFVTCVR
jgi:hypothetical protein